MSLTIEARVLSDEDLRPAGEARLRAARTMNAGIGCVGLIALVLGTTLLGGAVLIIWLTGAWKFTFWGVTLAAASVLLIIAGAAPFMIGLYALLSHVRKRVRLARHGWRALVPAPGTPGCEVITFSADEAWVIDNHLGEPVGIWRAREDTYLLAPTLEVEFVPEARPPAGALEHAGDAENDARPPRGHWNMPWGGRAVVFPNRELGWLRLGGPPRATPVLVADESAYEDQSAVADMMGDALPHPKVLIVPLRDLPRWIRFELFEHEALAREVHDAANDAPGAGGADAPGPSGSPAEGAADGPSPSDRTS